MNEVKKTQQKDLEKTLRERLNQLLGELRAQLEASENQDYNDLAGQLRDTGDEAAADVLSDIRLYDVQREVREIQEIRAALDRITTGQYGECIECGGDIQWERLRVEPEAARCLRCQQRWERDHSRGRPKQI